MTPLYLSEPSMVTPLGLGCEANAEALFNGRAALQSQVQWMELPRMVGAVSATLESIPAPLAEFDCRNNQLLLTALMPLLGRIDRLIDQHGSERLGIVIGSSTSGIAAGEAALAQAEQNTGQFPPGFDYRQQEIGTPALFLARYLKSAGPAYTISTACTSSAQAFISARALIEADLCDAVLVGGADSLCRLTVQGFSALESYSAGPCQPFAAGRDGINIGEGAVLFLLGKQPTGIRLAGCGASSDAYHISAPQPEGSGAELAIRAALKDAGLAPQDIDYLNLHGTATTKNDAMEALVVRRVFGRSSADAGLPCSSTKALTGHMLGAAGAMELAACVLALREQQMPLQSAVAYDPALPPLHLQTAPRSATLRTAMSTNYAFGGSNTALIVQTAP